MTTLEKILDQVDNNLDTSVDNLFEFLRIPSISTDNAYAEDCKKAAEYLVNRCKELGFESSAHDTGGHQVVIAKNHENKQDFVLFYGHYDVQPVDPLELWESPPFEPRLIECSDGSKKIVARGASDDKGQMFTFLEACRAYKEVTGSLPIALTLMLEGEEENGSLNLFPFIKKNAEEFKGKYALVCDTRMWDKDTPQITTSLRGMLYVEVKIISANRDLHSGHFGGIAANPIHILSKIISELKDETGRIMLEDFYEGVEELPDSIRSSWASLDSKSKSLLDSIGLSESIGERDRLLLEMTTSRPSCDVNGIWGGYTGVGSKTIIPSEASMKLSFRLVGKQDPKKIQNSLQSFVKARVPKDCKVEITTSKSSPALQIPYDMPELEMATQALSEEWGKPAVLLGSGGSISIIGEFKRLLDMDSLLIGFALDDDRIHSPNEKYELRSFHKGIRSWVRVLWKLGEGVE